MTWTLPDDAHLDAHRTRSNVRTTRTEHDVTTAGNTPTTATTTTSNTPTPITTEERA